MGSDYELESNGIFIRRKHELQHLSCLRAVDMENLIIERLSSRRSSIPDPEVNFQGIRKGLSPK